MDEPIWDDDARDEVRNAIRSRILGELRLTLNSREDILEICRESCIPEECPEDERGRFLQLVDDEFDRLEAEADAEAAGWPDETDSDRLDRVESGLLERGILLWQASPCCDTCTCAELGDRIEELETLHPGLRERLRGYSFFIDQNLPERLAESRRVSLYLAYGWISPDEGEAEPEAYKENALGIAREVCEVLRAEGFTPDWDGDFARKIEVELNWQRRTPLV